MGAVTLRFEFLGYWHAGSGKGQGAKLDAEVIKTPAGLPYLPGKTVKGLLREAYLTAKEAEYANSTQGLPPEESANQKFGTRTGEGQYVTRYDTDQAKLFPAKLYFPDATLGDGSEEWALNNKKEVRFLFSVIASTAIDERGMAKDDTLRRIEVAIPVSLTAKVEGEMDGKEMKELFSRIVPLVRTSGSWRHRGLGRVRVSVVEGDK